ncbi:hypothetical protein WJX72_000649 [[Myrmecia] bisecta]|uniref:Exonuclease 1 n=1 Tax=[Myrmecia] bisecta TaxID=41462 RepID=A0AAW1R4I5_9CHLO
MGIQGLLPVLKSIAKPAHVSKYRGQRVAVDAYAWLHKGAYACSMELCEGIPTDRFVTFCMQRVNLMRHNGVIPVIVFDGDRLPMKGEEEGSRHRSRQENRDKAAAHMAAGNKSAAYECYQRAVDITPLSAKRFIEALKLAGVEFIVAPYEADAQMAYLAMNGLVDAVITEDSDLLPYGCPRVFFKMDKTGDGQEIAIADLGHNRDLSFVGFSHQMFLEMCIFAGCDFLKALPGIGIKNAHKHVRKLKTFIKVCRALRFNGTSVPRGYEADFQRALWTFHHQRVFCPQSHKLVHLRELPAGGLAMSAALVAGGAAGTGPLAGAELDFLGPQIPDDLAYQVAVGNVDPISKEAFPELQPAVLRPISGSTLNATSAGSGKGSGQGSGPKRVSGTKRPLPVQANNITSYFASQPTSCTGAKKEFTAPRMSALAASAPLAPNASTGITGSAVRDRAGREYVSNASDASEPEQEMAAAHSGASGEDGDAGDAADHLPGAGPSFYSMAHMASFSRAAKQAVTQYPAITSRLELNG